MPNSEAPEEYQQNDSVYRTLNQNGDDGLLAAGFSCSVYPETMAGAAGQFNSVALDDIEVPGAGHTEAVISGDMAFIEKEYKDNLWPGGVEQGAEMDFDEF